MNKQASSSSASTVPALQVRDLSKSFGGRRGLIFNTRGAVQAVSNVNFEVWPGETLGVVGESGCGKSTMARLIMRLIRPDAGDIRVDGNMVSGDDRATLRRLRKDVQMVFQDSYASLNPKLTVAQTIMFGSRVRGVSVRDARQISDDFLQNVGLDPGRFSHRFPHQLSGGQRQRVNIARALSLEPQIVIMDEPVSALDKSVEAQVVNLLCDLRERLKLTYMFISHDLNVVQYIADRVLVMYLGKVVEVGKVDRIFDTPLHPYTRALISSAPSLDPDNLTTAAPIVGEPPDPLNPPSGCCFRTRCPFVEDVCARVEPVLSPSPAWPESNVACHMAKPDSGHSKGV